MLVRLDHVANAIVNLNHGIMRSTAKLCVLDSVSRLRVSEPTEWQRMGNQIKAAFIFARAYVNRNPRAIVTFS